MVGDLTEGLTISMTKLRMYNGTDELHHTPTMHFFIL